MVVAGLVVVACIIINRRLSQKTSESDEKSDSNGEATAEPDTDS